MINPVLVISCPWYLQCRPETAFALAQTYVDLAGTGQVYLTGAFDSPLPIARMYGLAQFMAMTDATHVLLPDSDIVWNPAHVRRLLSHDEPIVAVVGADKRTGRFYTGKIGVGRGQRVATKYDAERGLLEVDRCGMCFMLIRRDAIETMIKAYPELHLHAHELPDEALRPYFYAFFEYKAQDGWMPTEDFRFCDLARGAGLKVYVDAWIELQHIVPVARGGKLIDHLDFGEEEARLADPLAATGD
jgi:hypothetical protein